MTGMTCSSLTEKIYLPDGHGRRRASSTRRQVFAEGFNTEITGVAGGVLAFGGQRLHDDSAGSLEADRHQRGRAGGPAACRCRTGTASTSVTAVTTCTGRRWGRMGASTGRRGTRGTTSRRRRAELRAPVRGGGLPRRAGWVEPGGLRLGPAEPAGVGVRRLRQPLLRGQRRGHRRPRAVRLHHREVRFGVARDLPVPHAQDPGCERRRVQPLDGGGALEAAVRDAGRLPDAAAGATIPTARADSSTTRARRCRRSTRGTFS